MPAKKDTKKEFLDKFTEEMILHVKESRKKKQNDNSEEARRKKEIEAEKLRLKFAKYGEKQEEKKPGAIQAPAPVQAYAIKPAAPVKPAPAIVKPTPITTSQAPAAQTPTLSQARPPVAQKRPEMPLVKIPIPPKIPPVPPGEINFGKITFLVRDPMIMYIECPGENKNVIIRKAGGVATKTQITLSKVEIQGIIKSFAEKARIPVIEGMLKARVANLEISAVVSEVASPSFIIKKIILPPEKRPSQLQGPIIPRPAGMPMPGMPMPPIARPFISPGAAPAAIQTPAKPGEKKEGTGFFNKKIKFGK